MTSSNGNSSLSERIVAAPLEGGGISRANLFEGSDAAASRATSYSMRSGDTFNGNLSPEGDADWVRISLGPGVYEITLDGRGNSPLYDPYLRLMDASGTQVRFDDDGGSGLGSRIVLSVTTASTYYIEAGSYGDYYSGAYSLGVAAVDPGEVLTMDEIGEQLTDGYWEYAGVSRRSFDVAQGGALNVNLAGLTGAGRRLADMALSAWEDVLGINFNRNPGGGTAHITFDDYDEGAYSTSQVFGGEIISSFVNVSTSWLSNFGTDFNTYSYQTYIHEIGHALGLGHAGDYNGAATYGVDNSYANDSWQASIMSYFSQVDNTTIDASYAFVMSAMMADIQAMQDLYGTTSIRTGNNVYGEQTNAGESYATIARLLRNTDTRDDITFTIFDQGGTDRLDLRMDGNNQRIDLAPGSISNAYGLRGNISIAEGTLIEDLLAGRGDDLIYGNWANNQIQGGNGNDMIRGLAGNDELYGNSGSDTLIGGAGNDIVRGGGGNDTIYDDNGADVLLGGDGNDIIRGSGGNDTIYGNSGSDTLLGGAGNDVYFVDAGDRINEGANGGIDTIRTDLLTRLGANLENLQLISNTALDGYGNSLANRMLGNDADNRLYGLSGGDVLFGYGGNDTLVGGSGRDRLVGGQGRDHLAGGGDNDIYEWRSGDVILEGVNGGIDIIRATSTVAISANVENLVMMGTSVMHGFGNDLNNRITGNFADNFINGNDGNDILTGRGGSDNFVFNDGRDIITDFRDDMDTIRIDNALWGGAPRTRAQLLADADVIGGNTVFNFGNGNTLTVNGVTDTAILMNDLIII
ncbi:serralysin [Paracoccus halophilus]|uniref:Serralysin n=1 Tax=Paracoccus halophilus TaxID=376733 RepID=A0A1I0TQH2_9RHOB|nr:M10 family metallopeptidase [Paracoccus halophilus]SFA54014.1 serralysin [Paracoccus halophilus]